MADLGTNMNAVTSRLASQFEQVLEYPVNLVGAIISLPDRGLHGLKREILKPLELRFLRKHLIISATDQDHEAPERAVIAADIDEYLAASDWSALADYIKHVDRTRNATPSGVRHLEIATLHLREALSKEAENPDASNYEVSFDHTDATLKAVSDALEDDPDNYALAAILARLHLDCGWSARGSGWADAVGEAGWSAMNAHYHAAQDIITRFDPIAYNSPFLAEIQYRLCMGLENGRERLSTALLDWTDLDPDNLTIYRQHAYHCLPRWFGDYKILEEEACRMAEATSDTFGAAAYTTMMMHAMRFEDGAALYLKPELFSQGLQDLMAHFASNPYRVTSTLSELHDSLQYHYHHLLGAKRAKKRVARKIKKSMAPIAREHLTLFCSQAWTQTENDFLTDVAPAFQPELNRGATVMISPDGMNIVDQA